MSGDRPDSMPRCPDCQALLPRHRAGCTAPANPPSGAPTPSPLVEQVDAVDEPPTPENFYLLRANYRLALSRIAELSAALAAAVPAPTEPALADHYERAAEGTWGPDPFDDPVPTEEAPGCGHEKMLRDIHRWVSDPAMVAQVGRYGSAGSSMVAGSIRKGIEEEYPDWAPAAPVSLGEDSPSVSDERIDRSSSLGDEEAAR